MKAKFGLLWALIISLILAPAAWPQRPAAPAFQDTAVLPEGAQGARIRSLIETINSGDRDRIRRFLDEECTAEYRGASPLEEHISATLSLMRDTGGVEFVSIRSYTPERPGATVVIVKDRNFGGFWGLSLRFADLTGYLVAGLETSPARPPAGPPEPPIPEKDAVDEVRALTSGLIAKGWFSGTLLVAKGPAVLLTMAGGEASKSYHVPNNIDTKFNLGSMNKMFTATAVARLVELGRLSFDDPVGKWVDETWLPKEVTDKITVRHLITHTSGLGSYFNETYDRSSRALFRKLEDYKPLIKDDRPAFPPGERFRYSNTGMFLLGIVIEKVTGEDYFEHIRKTIATPVGMTNTDCYEMDYPVENLAVGYSPDWWSSYRWQANLYKHVIKGGPAGGGFSTVKDLHKFALALLGGKLVSKAMLETMWTDAKGANYGYGFTVAQGPGGKVVGHSGGFDGINSELDIYVDSGYVVAVMSNYDNGASPLAARIGRALARVR
ncbi:MAG TPA: serine hydrolase domain-containing protein [Terriglobales bacterium]|nr:serine hydrolase domain-containing protein [Terriglobales bacterium]